MKRIIKTSTALMAALCVSITISPNLLAISDAHVCEEPDHLLSYPLTLSAPFGGEAVITLLDQFLPATLIDEDVPLTFNIPADGFGVRLLNPATKWHNGQKFRPSHPETHYISFPIEPNPDPDLPMAPPVFGLVDGTFRVFNQFGSFDVVVDFDEEGDPEGDNNISADGLTLLVPSLKHACPDGNCPPRRGSSSHCPGCFPDDNHYLCYPLLIDSICPVDERFRLEDQFQKNRLFDGRLRPTRFCNPVVKTINGISSGSSDSETNHLTCYGIGERSLNPGRFVQLLNQFGEQRGFVEFDDEICVPSLKAAIPAPPPPVPASLRAFVTDGTYNGNLAGEANALSQGGTINLTEDYQCSVTGLDEDNDYLETGDSYEDDTLRSGVAAADCLCREQASTAGLTCINGGFGCWRAWISDDSMASEPNQRFNIATIAAFSSIPIYQVGGVTVPIATGGYADLTVCGVEDPIGACLDDAMINPAGWQNQFGNRVGGEVNSWTNTTEEGNSEATSSSCNNWNNTEVSGFFGVTDDITSDWTSPFNTNTCDNELRLYCFEDVIP